MTDAAALHALARHYLISREVELTKQGERLPVPPDRVPRAQVVSAILDDIEACTPADLGRLEEARQLLIAAALSAENLETDSVRWMAQEAAVGDERSRFVSYLEHVTSEELRAPPALPFRRTLTKREVASFWARLEDHWGVHRHHYWFPLSEARPASVVEVFNAYKVQDGDFAPIIRSTLHRMGCDRVFEIREWGTSREGDPSCLQLDYTGAEAYLFDASFSWLVYASHEGTVTTAGETVLEAITATWSEWRTAIWSGWGDS